MINKLKIMKKIIFILLTTISLVVSSQPVERWVEVGSTPYKIKMNGELITPYEVKLYLPYGSKNIADTKEGLYPMRFELTWLEEKYSTERVHELFHYQIESHFDDPEGFKLYENFIQLFIKKLVPTKKGDVWLFENYPDEGTRVFINDKQIHHIIGVEFNRAMYRSWLHENPILTAHLLSKLIKLN
jgi:hypothetical protein